MPKPVKSHSFRGKRYNIKKMPPSQMKKRYPNKDRKRTLGVCQDPRKKKKSLVFDKTLEGVEELDVYIHEATHACFWDLEEEAVGESSTDIAEFLWRLGYRKVH